MYRTLLTDRQTDRQQADSRQTARWQDRQTRSAAGDSVAVTHTHMYRDSFQEAT